MHCHIGSQIFEINPFELAAAVMINFMSDMGEKYDMKFKILNLGGGFGIKYVPENDPVEYDSYMKAVSKVVKDTCKKRGVKLPYILIEPGRSIVASAGITLYTVGSVKKIPNVRTYVSVDGGMTDNPRYALYNAEYDALAANKAGEERTETVTLAGRCCESGDIIQENIKLQKIKKGDIIAVCATGAYNYSMSSNYNRVPRPAAVMIKDKEPRLFIRREVLKTEIIHSFEPIADENSKILILGSMPSVASLSAGMYYSHPRNAFWRIMGDLTGDEVGNTNAEKRDFLLRNKIALWDTLSACERQGSLDSNIKCTVPNDIKSLTNKCKGIKQVFLNGGSALKFYKKYHCENIKIPYLALPSTSPANARGGYEKKYESWKIISNFLNE
jgi:hypoxanthine-DNA glycosylase